MKLNKLIVAAAISIFCSNLCTAQKSLDLEDVLSGKLIRTKGVGAMNWMKDGERYSRLEPNKEEGGMDDDHDVAYCADSGFSGNIYADDAQDP